MIYSDLHFFFSGQSHSYNLENLALCNSEGLQLAKGGGLTNNPKKGLHFVWSSLFHTFFFTPSSVQRDSRISECDLTWGISFFSTYSQPSMPILSVILLDNMVFLKLNISGLKNKNDLEMGQCYPKSDWTGGGKWKSSDVTRKDCLLRLEELINVLCCFMIMVFFGIQSLTANGTSKSLYHNQIASYDPGDCKGAG